MRHVRLEASFPSRSQKSLKERRQFDRTNKHTDARANTQVYCTDSPRGRRGAPFHQSTWAKAALHWLYTCNDSLKWGSAVVLTCTCDEGGRGRRPGVHVWKCETIAENYPSCIKFASTSTNRHGSPRNERKTSRPTARQRGGWDKREGDPDKFTRTRL